MVHAPVDKDKDKAALSSLLVPGQQIPARGPAVLWLDDLEPFRNSGLTLHALREWRAKAPGRIVVATHGGKGRDLVGDAKALTTAAAGLLAHAHRITMAQTSDAEIESLRPALDRRSPTSRTRRSSARGPIRSTLLTCCGQQC
ncbi:hypothetical protein [Nocardia jiangxiensis]|uniref:hypothetical protein n=1 Tax=Nocardia jiangxiensis TaxID=282685 RepID=UPI0012F70460|nr:hypothetical protein [Nocardia jiangxiensis]